MSGVAVVRLRDEPTSRPRRRRIVAAAGWRVVAGVRPCRPDDADIAVRALVHSTSPRQETNDATH